MRPPVLRGITHRFQCLSHSDGQVAHALRTLPPVAAIVLLQRAAPRLACVKPAASVHPEPGSNSSLYILIFLARCLEIDALDLLSFLGTCFLYFPFSLFNELLFSSLFAVCFVGLRRSAGHNQQVAHALSPRPPCIQSKTDLESFFRRNLRKKSRYFFKRDCKDKDIF